MKQACDILDIVIDRTNSIYEGLYEQIECRKCGHTGNKHRFKDQKEYLANKVYDAITEEIRAHVKGSADASQ